LTMIRFKE